MKYFLLVFVCLASVVSLNAQEIAPVDIHKFFIGKEIKAISELQYWDGTPIKGKLSTDGMSVIMIDYSKRGTIKVKIKNLDGSEELITRTSCDIIKEDEPL